MIKDVQSLTLLPQGNFDSYVRTANAYSILTAEQERELAKQLYYHGDLDAAKQLILSHLRFVIHIARSYSGYGLPQADLVQEGNIGLMKAVRRFNPELNVRLVSFAVHWIKAEIHEYVLRNWRIVKVATTKAQRKLFFNLRKTKQRLGWFSSCEVDLVAKELSVSTKDVREMESRMSARDMAFDQPVDDEYRETVVPMLYFLQDRNDVFFEYEENWDFNLTERINKALEFLDERSRHIIYSRWLDSDSKMTLQELADQYGISAERVRQLEKNAMRKMKLVIESNQCESKKCLC